MVVFLVMSFFRLGKGRDKATKLDDMTPSERLLWYRRNVEAVDEDSGKDKVLSYLSLAALPRYS